MSFPDYSAIFPYGFSTSSATGASLASGGSGASSPSSPVAGAPPSSAMVGPALSAASQLDSADLSDGEDAVAVPKWRSIPVEVDSDGLSDRVGSPSGSPSKVGPGLGPSSLGSPGSPTPSELSRFSSASEIQRREAASQGLTDVLGAHARATLVQGSPSAKASSTVPTGQAFVASAPPSAGLGPPELFYFRPMVSALGAQLRVSKERQPRGKAVGHKTPEERDLASLWVEARHLFQCLPDQAKANISAGRAAGTEAASWNAGSGDSVLEAIAKIGGNAGKSLGAARQTLAKLADFMFEPPPGSNLPQQLLFTGPVDVPTLTAFVRNERARGTVEKAYSAAPHALSNVRFAADHLGLVVPDTTSGTILAEAVDSPWPPSTPSGAPTRQAAPIPAAVIIRAETLAQAAAHNQTSEVFRFWVRSTLIGFYAGLRVCEMETVRISTDAQESDPLRVISGWYRPKGKDKLVRRQFHIYAHGISGPFH